MRSWHTILSGLALVASALSLPQHYYRNVDYEHEKAAYIRLLEAQVEAAARAGRAAEALQLEDRLEDSILEQARASVRRDSGDPGRAARDLADLQQEWRRDKRAVDFLSGLLGSSSGGGGGGGGAGSDSGSILNLVGPLLGSSSGGSSGGGGDGESGGSAGGSDSGSILNLVGPLLGSSSGGGGGGEGESAGGSDSGSILNLVGPLLGSSSGGGGAGGEGGDAGSGSASILNLVGPLLGSSSGGSGGDASGGGGGSDLSSILGVSNSSGGGAGGGEAHAGGGGLGGVVNEVKVGFLQDKIQLLLRLKFGIFTKLLNTLSGALAAASSPQHVPIDQLKYPDP